MAIVTHVHAGAWYVTKHVLQQAKERVPAMGLLDFMRKPQPLVSARKAAKLKGADGIDAALLDQPLFGDYVACMAVLVKTDIDTTRLASRSYLKHIVGGRTTVADRSMKKLFQAVGINGGRLAEEGYINKCLRQMSDTASVAKKKGEPAAVVDQCTSALNVSALAFSRFILEQHPEYAEVVPALSAAVRDRL